MVVHVIGVLGKAVEDAPHRRGVEEGDGCVQQAAQRVLVNLDSHQQHSSGALLMSCDQPDLKTGIYVGGKEQIAQQLATSE